jgi:hypothetical protein
LFSIGGRSPRQPRADIRLGEENEFVCFCKHHAIIAWANLRVPRDCQICDIGVQ